MPGEGVGLHLRFRYVGQREPTYFDPQTIERAEPETFDFVNVVFAVEGLYRVAAAMDPEVREYVEREQIEWQEQPLPIASRLPESLRVGVESFTLRSPLEIVLHIPEVFVALGAGAALLRFLRLIETTWNMPRRIRLEQAHRAPARGRAPCGRRGHGGVLPAFGEPVELPARRGRGVGVAQAQAGRLNRNWPPWLV
jgi:hypothetical protein